MERLNFVEQSETINLTSRTLMLGKQFLLVTSSKPACRCLLFSLLHVKRWKRETFLHATEEIGDVCTQVTLKWPWWVKKQLHNNLSIHLLGISQLLRNKLFIESFLIIRLYHIIFCLSFLKTFVINLPTKMCDR